MSKKKILLIVRRHVGEIDFILPLLYRLKDNFEIITIFSEYNSYETLLNSKELYFLWKKICSKYFIVSNKKKIIYKTILKIITLIENKMFIQNDLKFFLLKKIFEFDIFLKKFRLNTNDINLIFTPIVNQTSLPYLIKSLSKNSKLVRFSEATWIFPNKAQNKILYDNNKVYIDNNTDLYLLTNNNFNYYLGNKIDDNLRKKILYTGFFRYENFWIKKIKKLKDNFKKKKKIVVIATRGPNNVGLKLSSFIYIIESIVKSAKKIKNIKIIFKIHPNKFQDEINVIKEITLKNNFKSYILSTNHPINLAIDAHVCISINTSVCLDFLYAKKSVIEFFDAKKENKNNAGIIFNVKKNKWVSNFENYKLVNNVKNDEEFNYQFNRHLKNKSKLNRLNFKILKKINSKSFDSLKLSNYLKNIQY